MTRSLHSLLLVLLIFCQGCDKSDSVAEAEGLNVVTTTTMVTDLVRGVIGETDISLLPLMGPGVDPHLYKASAMDVIKLSKADLIIYNGLMLEGKMGDTFDKMKGKGVRVVAIADALPRESLLKPAEFNGHWDPHIWFDAQLWRAVVPSVVAALSDVDPRNAAVYKQNGDALMEHYAAVDAWVRARVKELPANKRILVTSHDAYNYFGRAYGFDVVGVQGISTVTEAGLADITKTVDLIREKGIKCIFVESSVRPDTIKQISQESGAKIGGELFSDAMGVAGELETGSGGEAYDLGSWEGMVKHNVNTIVDSLK